MRITMRGNELADHGRRQDALAERLIAGVFLLAAGLWFLM